MKLISPSKPYIYEKIWFKSLDMKLVPAFPSVSGNTRLHSLLWQKQGRGIWCPLNWELPTGAIRADHHHPTAPSPCWVTEGWVGEAPLASPRSKRTLLLETHAPDEDKAHAAAATNLNFGPLSEGFFLPSCFSRVPARCAHARWQIAPAHGISIKWEIHSRLAQTTARALKHTQAVQRASLCRWLSLSEWKLPAEREEICLQGPSILC